MSGYNKPSELWRRNALPVQRLVPNALGLGLLIVWTLTKLLRGSGALNSGAQGKRAQRALRQQILTRCLSEARPCARMPCPRSKRMAHLAARVRIRGGLNTNVEEAMRTGTAWLRLSGGTQG